MMGYYQDASRADKTFMETCAAPLQKLFRASAIISTAAHRGLERQLDFCGVDYIVPSSRYGLIPIQAKISFGVKPYRNFVIRRSRSSGAATDFDKLSRARKYGTIAPLWHCACFVDDAGNVDAALVRTADLLNFIESGQAEEKFFQNGSFYTCDWQRLEQCGVKLLHLVHRADSTKEVSA